MNRWLVVMLALSVPCLATAQLGLRDIAALQAEAKAKGWTFEVGETPATSQPNEALCGTSPPDDWKARAPFTKFETKGLLPASFDWRALGGVTPIKNQGGCGSCWAFATVGTFECAIRIKDGVMVNLAEQWLVSCNQETQAPHVLGKGAWGCNGGWWAHDYHAGLMTDPCGGTGGVLTAYCPYYGDVSTCGCPYPHDYAMDGWAYIAGEDVVPDASAIKQAIMDYGPVCAAVYVNDAFKSYKNGVFNASEDKEVNHGIVLVGWDDTQGTNGVWFLRNSWSNAWGEGGYMRIEYGCSRVGFGASYVMYAGRGLGTPPTITRQPHDTDVPQGWFGTLSVAASGVGDLHYQWLHNGEPVGTDSATLTIGHAGPDDEGTYTCRVTDARGTATSSAAQFMLDLGETVPLASGLGLALCAALCMLCGVRRLDAALPRRGSMRRR